MHRIALVGMGLVVVARRIADKTHHAQGGLLGPALACGALMGLLAAPSAAAPPTGFDGHQVVHIVVRDALDMDTVRGLQSLGDDFEVWSEVIKPGLVEARVAPAALPMLDFSGLEYAVVIPDLQTYLNNAFGGPQDAGFFDALRTYDEHVQFMQQLVATYPNLVSMENLGLSVEGRPLWALRLTGPGYAKPTVFFHGAEHGNESATSSIVAYIANHLLTNYQTNPQVAALVDRVEWVLLPIMNPDGYVRNRRYNAHNVDLNRNWDGPGAGQDPSGGAYPFSEPETQHLRDLILAEPGIRVHVDLHGYVPWIMWVWGHIPDHCPEHATYLQLGGQMRDRIAAAGGGTYDIGTIYEVAYPVSGCSTNYSYAVGGRWAFGIEVRNNTMPAICQQFLNAMLYLGAWIWSYDCNANGVPDAQDILAGTSTDVNHDGTPDECQGVGDVNCDYAVDFGDINPFVLALTNPGGYQQQYPNCPLPNRDINGDGRVDFGDINPFVRLLTSP